MPENNDLPPGVAAACYLTGFVVMIAAPKLADKMAERRIRKQRIRTLGEWLTTAQDIRNLPEVLED